MVSLIACLNVLLWGLQLRYSAVFFAAAFLVALRPERLTRWLGRLLCPCLLVLISVLFGGCLLHPLAGQYGAPTPEYTSGAVLQGVLYGYQTMDTLAALNFGAVIALNIQAQGITRQEEVQRSTILAGFVAGGLLLAVYAMLGHAGALTGAAVPGLATGADVLTVLADRLFAGRTAAGCLPGPGLRAAYWQRQKIRQRPGRAQRAPGCGSTPPHRQ
mgnify:CR=1 FL=1